MQRVAITGYGAHYLAPGASEVNWLSSLPSNRLSRVPGQEGGALLALIQAESRELLPDPAELALVWGCSKGDTQALAQWAMDGKEGSWNWVPDAPAHRLARELGIDGPVLSPNAACATGAHALALGAQWVQDGRAELVIAGAIEFPQHALVLAGYRNMGALSKSGVMRPFDARRDGFLPSSGAGFFVLQSEARARQHHIPILGFLSGWSMKCDATHMTAMSPGGETIVRAIEDALQRAGKPEIGYINAHGTATRLNDAIETRAIAAMFGREVPVSSTKAQTGHLLGAAGAVEAVLTLQALREGILPPTLGLERVDSEFELDFVRGAPREAQIQAALSLNYGFGGHIGALVLERGF